jgi:hypothetical protein
VLVHWQNFVHDFYFIEEMVVQFVVAVAVAVVVNGNGGCD